jgi:thymidylate synthase (FAD)
MPDDYYVPSPESIAVQSSNNKQGRGETVDPDYADEVIKRWEANGVRNYADYRFLINDDGTGKPFDPGRPQIARELARNVLPVDFYTEWYWKIDLHNLFHFLELRLDPHAQWEIRQYANAMGQITEDSFPLAWKAFEDYELYSVDLSRPEQNVLALLIEQSGLSFTPEQILEVAGKTGLKNKRETNEMIEKLSALGLIKK